MGPVEQKGIRRLLPVAPAGRYPYLFVFSRPAHRLVLFLRLEVGEPLDSPGMDCRDSTYDEPCKERPNQYP